MVNRGDLRAPWRASVILGAGAAIAALALPPLATGASVTFTSSNCTSYVLSGTAPNQTVTCVGGGGVPVCAPTAQPPSPAAGETTTISANCSNAPTSYTWTGGTCGRAAATCVVSKGKPASVTYTVKASNGSGTGAAASITVTWH